MMEMDSILHNNYVRVLNGKGPSGKEGRHESKGSEEGEASTIDAEGSEDG
jgi:hypothetical protein